MIAMRLQFVLGRGNTAKQSYLLDEIGETLTADPTAKLLYLIPEHMSFQTEMSVLEGLGKMPAFQDQKLIGMMNLQVFSFRRLAWYFLQDSSLYHKPQLTNTGLTMLVRKLLLQYENELTIYRGEVKKSGFVEKLTELFLELRSGKITESDLQELLKQPGNSPKEADLKLKLQDIVLLYHAFENALLGKYLEKEDILTALATKIETVDLSNTTIYIDGYTRFNAQEQALIVALMKASKKVTIALTLDKGYPTEKPSMFELFQATGETYYQLYQAARGHGIQVEHDKILKESDARYSEEINQLEDFWVETSKLLPIDYRKKQERIPMSNCVEVWQASNKQVEVTHVAKEIRRLIASKEYRYQDILVLARDMSEYQSILEPIFKENELEVFTDDAAVMSHHPLAEFLVAMLAIKKNNWRYQDVMRLLRTELLLPLQQVEESVDRTTRVLMKQNHINNFRNKIDITENVVLMYGYEGFYWTQKKPWHYSRFVQEETAGQTTEDQRIEGIANEVRDFLQKTLLPFFKKLDQATNGLSFAKELYEFLEKSGVSQQLSFWRDQEIEKNNLEVAKQHEQTWDVLLQLLDEYVEILGTESVDLDAFNDILIAGFEGASYHLVPPTIDQIMFSPFDTTRRNATKITFILGMTDTNLPAKIENKSVLTQEDRTYFSEFLPEDKFLAPSVESLTATEPLQAYLAFLSSTERLIFSYSKNDDSKQSAQLSSYIQRIVTGLDIPIQTKVEDSTTILEEQEEALRFIGSKRSTLSQLLVVLRKSQEENSPLDHFWYGIYQYLTGSGGMKELTKQVLKSLTYKNVPKPLKPEIVSELYGKELYTSVSRMENFYSCHYKHFVTYGLGLKERQVFGLSPAGTGEFFHDALDQLFKSLHSQNILLSELTEETLSKVTDDVLQVIYGKPKFSILTVSNRMNYIRYQLSQTIQRVAWALSNQSRKTGMSTIETEVLFGQIASQKGIEGLEIPLKNDGKLHVRGKIDRVDGMEVDGSHYLSIVDYKSSAHTFDYRDAYYGLAMQMITYLDTALMNSVSLVGHEAKPAGAFYLHVKNPFINDEDASDEEHYQDSLLKNFKLDGILLEDDPMLRKLDQSLEPTNSSLVYPYRELKDETLKSAKFVTNDEMAALRNHNNRLFKKAGDKIISGDTDLNPYYKDKQRIACGMCPFRSICEFDVMLPENNYHRVDPLSQKDALERMLKEEGEKDE